MKGLETFGAYALATTLQAPFLVFLATPWLLAALLSLYFSRRHLNGVARMTLAASIAAAGLAPAYGFHLSMMPMYLLVWSGNAEPAAALISYFVTLAVLLAASWLVSMVRKRRPAPAP